MLTNSVISAGLNGEAIALCTAASLLIGVVIAATHRMKNHCSKGFLVTLVLLPAVVQAVIMMVNGNIGTGVAVAGTFSLVRFRSVPGSARDIMSIFTAMAVGLATGMGYLLFAAGLAVVIGLVSVLLFVSPIGDDKDGARVLRITVPEQLDYEHVFDDTLAQYTSRARLDRVRTLNMGSLFEISYQVDLKRGASSKDFLDALRCLNGNLNIILSRPVAVGGEL